MRTSSAPFGAATARFVAARLLGAVRGVAAGFVERFVGDEGIEGRSGVRSRDSRSAG